MTNIELIQQLRQFIEDNNLVEPNTTLDELEERIGKLVDLSEIDSPIIQQTNHPHSVGIQAYVEKGASANFGLNLNIPDSITRDEFFSAIKAILESILSTEIPPNNVPRSGVAKFIGRELELEQLHTQLQQGMVSVWAVEGMGGVGKTELAIQYTKQYASVYKGGFCWLFAREFNIGTQIVGFAQAQLSLKIPGGLELTDQVSFCYRNWREGEVLLVLDDVVNYSRDVEPYLPPPAFSRFKILMTTRLKFGPPIQRISLNELSPEQSLELLTVLIGEDRVQQELDIAKKLCTWLEHLPLGIELVGRYLLGQTDLSLSTLLILLKDKAKKRELIKHYALKIDERRQPSTAKRGVEAAFDLSWDELDKNAQHLGMLLSLFAHVPISWSLVKYCGNFDGRRKFSFEEVEGDRTELLALHLLQLSQPKEQIYRLHSLIREFFRSKLESSSTSNDLRQAFVRSTSFALARISGKRTPEEIIESNPEIGDIEWVLFHCGELFELHLETGEYDQAAEVLTGINYRLSLSGDYQIIVERCQMLEGKITEPLWERSRLNYLGLAFERMGNYSSAIDCHEKMFASANECKSTKSMVAAKRNLGNCYYELKQIDNAIQCYQFANKLDEQQGDSKSFLCWGVCNHEQGKIKEAIQQYKKARRRAINEKDILRLGESLLNLCDSYRALNKLNIAIKYGKKAEEVLNKSQDLYGLGLNFHHLAAIFLDLEEYPQAIEYATQGINLGLKTKDSKLLNKTYSILACTYLFMGNNYLPKSQDNAKLATQYNYPANNYYVYLLLGLIAIQQGLQEQHNAGAEKAFAEALSQASNLLIYNQQDYEALYTKCLSLCGLSLCKNQDYIKDAISSYKQVFAVNRELPYYSHYERLFNILLRSDTKGDLIEISANIKSSHKINSKLKRLSS